MSRSAVALPLVLLLALGAGSCRGPATGPIPASVAREFEREFERDLATTWRAAVSAVHAAGLVVPLEAQLGAEGGRIETEGLRLRVEPVEPNVSRVRARFLGYPIDEHEAAARDLLAEIARRLE